MKLLNNFKNPDKMIRESQKDLPQNFLAVKIVNRGDKKITVKKQISFSVITEASFLDRYNRILFFKVFKQYKCPLAFNAFFNVIDLPWFMRRFAFNTQSEVRKECKFFTTLLNKTPAYIVEVNGQVYLIQ